MPEIPLSIAEAASAFRRGSLSSVELTTAMLERATQWDGVLGVYLDRFDDTALEAARRSDDERSQGIDRGPLHGIPLAVKDILATHDGPTTANSLVLDPAWGEGRDAAVVSRLREAGAVVIGKVTTMEFAIGSPDFSKPFPIPRNPWDLATWPGGSSSGTGAGVAAGFFLGGLGTDTGGSIRIPSAYCGISGLMPTFGRVPKSGCVPLGYSLDHVGPMARSARDCGLILQVIAGQDPADPDSAAVPVASFTSDRPDGGTGSLEGMRIGVDRGHFQAADPACEPCFDDALAVMRERGATLVDVSLPYYLEVQAVCLVTMYAEALAYHLPDLRARWDDFFQVTRTTIAQGALVTGADYVQAQRVRQAAIREVDRLFQSVDVVAMPTITQGAIPYELLGEGGQRTETMFSSINTPYWDPLGNPVLALPMGFTRDGRPLSLQLAGRPFDEATLVRAGEAYQGQTDWHRRRPDLESQSSFDPVAERDRVAAIGSARAVQIPDGASTVGERLAAAGLHVPPADLAAIAHAAARLDLLVAALHAASGARDEDPALSFRRMLG